VATIATIVTDAEGRRFIKAPGRRSVAIEWYCLRRWGRLHKMLTRLTRPELRRCLDREWARSKALGGPRRTFLLRLAVRLGRLNIEEEVRIIKANVPSNARPKRPRLTCDELQNRIDALLPRAETKTHWATIRRWTRQLKARRPDEIAAIAASSKDRKRYPLPDHEHQKGIPCPYGCPMENV
jgi:hypothetical protein